MGAIASYMTATDANDSSHDAYEHDITHAVYEFSHIRTINPCNTTREWQYFEDPTAPFEKDPLHPKNPYVYTSSRCVLVFSRHPPKDGKKRAYTGKEIGIGDDAICKTHFSYYPPVPRPE